MVAAGAFQGEEAAPTATAAGFVAYTQGVESMSAELLNAALDYGARGWPVFPVTSKAKRPDGRLAPHGLNDATTDPEIIQAWWSRRPEANIGLRTGVAFDVLDIDGLTGGIALGNYRQGHGLSMTLGIVSATGGDGLHLLFLPTGIGNRAGFLDHCDWRGQGGYIVAPPSIHPTGRAYRWMDGDTALEPAPDWLVELVRPTPTAVTVATTPLRTATTRSASYGRRALHSEMAKLAATVEGQRNHQVNRSAFALGQLIVEGTLDAHEAIEALHGTALAIGLGDREATTTICSGVRAGMANPRKRMA